MHLMDYYMPCLEHSQWLHAPLFDFYVEVCWSKLLVFLAVTTNGEEASAPSLRILRLLTADT